MRCLNFLVFFFLFCWLSPTDVACQGSLEFIHTGVIGSPYFYDESGRIRVFHGSNRVEKQEPWFFVDMQKSDAEYEEMARIGFNVIRLGFMWSGYNPQPGVFNETYLSLIKNEVDKMNKYGIYALLDMHQDVLSSKFCLYDGIPLWVMNKSTSPHPFPWPLTGNCTSRGWMDNILSEAAATGYQDLYDNKQGMLDDLVTFWTHAATLLNNIPGIIGYELINEPFIGNFYKDISLFLPGIAGSKNLQPMHDKIAKSIRTVDTKHIIFYEPITWGMILDNKVIGSGFDHVPGGAEYQNVSAYSYHYYCDSFVPGYDGKPTLRKVVCDSLIGPLVFDAVNKDLAQLGGAAMMTEGLACNSANDNTTAECIEVLSRLDKNIFSWTDWANAQDETWSPNDRQKKVWARTYARAVAGKPVQMEFDPVSKLFNFCFLLDLSIKAPTEVFASSSFTYTNGFTFNTTSNIQAKASGDVLIINPSSQAVNNEQACITISQK